MPLLQQLLLLWAVWCPLARAGKPACPGRIGLRGHGPVSLVPAGWRTAVESGDVEVLGETVVMPHLRSRAYFADSCAAGVYNQSSYLALKVLGKTMRYMTDLKGAGCGCNAGFYLVPMSHNVQPSTCHDHYCDANSVCGVSCAEIDIQEANQYAWHSTLHTADDSDGLAGGNGGGGESGLEGPRDWPNAQYAPGSGCIDTSKPFQVSASFPVDAAGNLIALEVTLSQEGHTCSLPTQVHGYAGLKELSPILAKGVTPVVSYWSSNNMRWLDGPGDDGRGPCSNDTATECHDTVQFYDFSIRDIEALPSNEGVSKTAFTSEERVALTCPGAVPVEGYGSVSLVPAGWHGPPSPHVLVAASPDAVHVNESREVVLHSGSRSYFADTCEAGSYNNWEYVAWDLLGKRLRYTTDVSQVACGCTAALYLIPMRHNTEAGECGDYYCDASSLCGVSCAEIVIQEANNLTWLSTLRSREHTDGLKQWTFPGYSSGDDCIDPSRPFEVVVDFPLNESGQLTTLKVHAEQGQSTCDLNMDLGDHRALAEFSHALSKGVTPVVSHWRQGSFRSGDVVGEEDCTPMDCSSAAKFYGFSVQSLIPGRPRGPNLGPSSKGASQAEATHEAASAAVFAAAAELMGREKEVDRQKEREPRCPGSIHVKGHGKVSLVPNGWKTGSIGTAGVSVHEGKQVLTTMGSRGYFADACTAGGYQREQYVALNLLGKTLRYTTDLSGAGCGCNAAFYLVSMRQNPRPSECYDYYCDANNVCGESCDEIDIQEGNMFAWHSTLHTWKDHNGLSGGFGGGGEEWNGPREWNASEFGPGATCIDTNHPVQVAVSFPLDQAGSLSGMEVKLTQERLGNCSLHTAIESYTGLSELSAALSLGMTPVVSYWSSDDMLWLDGAGKDGLGPCARDNASSCSESVRFYDFELEDMPTVKPTARVQGSDMPKGDGQTSPPRPPHGPGFCPGEVHVAGHGKVALVPSGNTSHESSKLATVVDGREVRSAIGGRIYFADSCTPDAYDPSSFGAWKLLGKTLRYTTDVSRAGVSGAGCGCTGAFYLVAMPQNKRPGACGDYYCDASGACGESCVEIDIQKANKFAWHSTVHGAKDHTGLSVQGGGYDWNGPHMWTSSQYAPGAKCIDTARPFEVAVSFPADSEGKLLAVEVNLTQAGCSLTGRIHGYEEMPAVSAAVEAGMTPVISYSSESDNLLRTGRHQDKCSESSSVSCGESVSFYDVAVEELAPKTSTTAVATPLALGPELSAGEAAEKVLARLKSMEKAEAIALQKARESMVEDKRLEAAEAVAHQADEDAKATVQLAPQLPPALAGGEPQEGCAEAFKQCGGFGFNKAHCCLTGCHCQAQSIYYSQCIPVVQEQDTCEAAAAATVAGLAAAIGAPAPAPVAAVFAAAAPMVVGTAGASLQPQPTLPAPHAIRAGHEEFLMRKSAKQESIDPLRQRLVHGDLLATAVLCIALVAMTVAGILARKRSWRKGPCDAEHAQRALALRYHPLPPPEVISRNPTEELPVGQSGQAMMAAD